MQKSLRFGLLVLIAFLADSVSHAYGNRAFLFGKAQYFAIGIFSQMLWSSFATDLSRTGRWIETLSQLVLPSVCLLYVWHRNYAVLVWGLVFGSVLTAKVTERPRGVATFVLQVFESRWLGLLGRISYSTYLVHLPVLFGVLWALQLPAQRLGNLPLLALLFLIGGITTYIASWCLWRFVEKPFIDLGTRLCSTTNARE